MMRKTILILVCIGLFSPSIIAQRGKTGKPEAKKENEGYVFTPVVDLKTTSVKNQASTGTCWCFATISFFESELLRMGKGEYDLSEMFIVRNKMCIRDRVRTVQMMSNSLPVDVKRIYLDYRSRTSVNLIRVIARNFWKREPEWINTRCV